jgi:hypothetical protein
MRDGLAGTILLIALVVVAALWAVGIDAPWVQ